MFGIQLTRFDSTGKTNGTRKSPKFSDTQNGWYNDPKLQAKRFYHRVMHPNDADNIANSVDPDQTAPLGVV